MEGSQLRLLSLTVLDILSVGSCWASGALQPSLIGSGAVVRFLILLSPWPQDDGGGVKVQ